ncbi:MAG TPA: ABC transporter ATP-binding protein [Mycobacteriales bacterium]|nr:ABC transporter ATP-binding protein [Mycobacteriales bacterium]
MTATIEVRNLVKSYRQVQAVAGLDLTVESGECVAVLGANGAGKTTMVEILEGFRTRDSGQVSVLGVDPATGGRALRERVGVVLQSCAVERYLTVAELVRLHAGYYPHPRDVDEVLEMMGLAGKRDARVRTLSGGQQRRVDVALGIIGDPDLIFLDEPTTGFDPSARRTAWAMVENLRSLGKTVLLTTHYMDEAQHLADRVVVMARGRVVAEGRPDELGGRGEGAARVRFTLPDGVGVADLPMAVTPDGDAVVVETDKPTGVLHELTGWAVARGVELSGLTVTRPSLEDIYLRLTGEEQR